MTVEDNSKLKIDVAGSEPPAPFIPSPPTQPAGVSSVGRSLGPPLPASVQSASVPAPVGVSVPAGDVRSSDRRDAAAHGDWVMEEIRGARINVLRDEQLRRVLAG